MACLYAQGVYSYTYFHREGSVEVAAPRKLTDEEAAAQVGGWAALFVCVCVQGCEACPGKGCRAAGSAARCMLVPLVAPGKQSTLMSAQHRRSHAPCHGPHRRMLPRLWPQAERDRAASAAGTSAWNAAGTFEERDWTGCVFWSIMMLRQGHHGRGMGSCLAACGQQAGVHVGGAPCAPLLTAF
jgi:hypothetical protein